MNERNCWEYQYAHWGLGNQTDRPTYNMDIVICVQLFKL